MRWTDELLDGMRERGDPPADDVLRAIHDAEGLEAVNAVLSTMVRNAGTPPRTLPPVVRCYLAEQRSPPTAEERPLIDEAEAFFATHGVTVLMLLGFSSLPQTYASKNGSHVLVFTQRLTRDTQRRVMETFQFILDALSPGGLSPGGKGIRDAQKIRLMHAAIRRYVAAQPDYDAAWGLPVNQEDLAGTMLAFSTVILDGFRTLGIPLTARQELAFFTAWKVLGRNLGVSPELMPTDPDDGRALFERIRERQWGASDSGHQLVSAIVAFYDRFMPGLLATMPATQIRHFAGDRCADALGLPPPDWTGVVLAAVNLLDREFHLVEDRSEALSALGRHVTLGVLRGMEGALRGDRPLFQIPLPLRGRWFPPEPDDAPRIDVSEALTRGVGRLRALQEPEGWWWDRNRGGPAMSGMWLCAEGFCGTLDRAKRDGAVAWLREHQLGNGGFADSVDADLATGTSTATVLAGLVAAGVPASDPLVASARAWLDANGGWPADPVTGAFLAMAGLIPPDQVAGPPSSIALIPGLSRVLARRLQGFYLLTLFEVPAILDGLRRGRRKPPLWRVGSRLTRRRILSWLEHRQDRTGSWLGVMPVTALGLCALVAEGLPLTDRRVRDALASLRRLVVTDASGRVFAQPYSSEVWDTAMACRAMVEAGVSPSDPAVRRGLAFLRAEQGRRPEPWDLQTPRPGAPRTGGWPFEAGNELGLDPDSTAMVLACLARAGAPEDRVDNEAASRDGLAWMLGMQNPDGGWPAFGWGQASKPRGPIGTEVPPTPDGVLGVLKLLVDTPPILRDPATEELTGRALLALGLLGHGPDTPEVRAARAFLADQVWTNDAWFGRWTTNFVASTSYVLLGLASVGVDASDPMVRQALDWLLSFQHPDGAWGEGTETYASPELAGRGAPSATQTALAVWALCAHGYGRTRSVERGVRWLLHTQEEGGGWTDPGPLSVLVPPTMFYGEDLLPDYLGLFALSAYGRAW